MAGTRLDRHRDPARLRAGKRLERRAGRRCSSLIDGSDIHDLSAGAGRGQRGRLRAVVPELARARGPRKDLPIRAHPLLLFNPDSRSANLLIPGLVAILLTFSGTLLAAFAIVRERERGTLEQLMVTPASPVAVVLGKLLPYLALAFVQLLFVLFLMTVVFRVPIHGSLLLLLGLSVIYLFALLSLGLLVSSRARASQMEAIQLAQMILLPSIMLSGYIFPLSSLPAPAPPLADSSGDALHRDLARDHHPRGGVRRPLPRGGGALVIDLDGVADGERDDLPPPAVVRSSGRIAS